MSAGVLPVSLLALAMGAAPAPPQAAPAGSMRFAAMDRNQDGVVTRDEWQGSERSFRVHDWNNDGVLSGDELEPDARGPRGASSDRAASPRPRSSDAEVTARFDRLDRNRDGVIGLDEWWSTDDSFDRIDRNHDGVITRAELAAGTAPASPQSAAYRAGYERGTVEGREAGREDKTRNHWDLEGQRELETADSGYAPSMGSRSDYQSGYREAFRRAYAQGFNGDGATATHSPAYRAGYDRGMAEGREAGREDKKLRNAWDLDGQRELEQADSGYTPGLGSRAEYQGGYRAGFRKGYGEGFGPH